MKLVFDPQAGKDTANIWRTLRDDLKKEGLLQPQIKTDKPEQIIAYIKESMNKVNRRKILAMFDEADDFLDADARDNFRVVTQLREVMLETGRRFKVIFAGLHNVQRFQGIPNQPLAHFGRPICMGPLEPEAAQNLIQQPLETLGYRFVDNSSALRILSYTNYHPGLIQLFCQELLKRLHGGPGKLLPPYFVDQKDVEAIYLISDVRERIRERLDWTLALDMRYQTIAWALIEDQMQVKDSYARPYSPGEILKLVRFWWEKGFKAIGTDQLVGLLNEMCGLGVLVRNTEGHYRLRSPNLVRLMGTEVDIGNRLLEQSDKEPPAQLNADSHHALIEETGNIYSPLTYAQDRTLSQRQFGVGLICGSHALGLPLLPKALNRYLPFDQSEEEQGIFTEIPSNVVDPEVLVRWLDNHLETHTKEQTHVVYLQPMNPSLTPLQNLFQESLRFCQRHQSSKRWMRVFFLFDPNATWAWLTLPRLLREELENRADACICPRRWDSLGVKHRLAQHNMIYSDEVCKTVLAITGGWPIILEILLNRCAKEDDPRPCAKEIERELIDPSSQLYMEFRSSLGLNTSPLALNLLEGMIKLQENEIPIDFLTPELVESQSAVTPEQIAQSIEFLDRMGCIEFQGESVSLENLTRRVFSGP
jgi:hypothetical protein